MRERLLVVLFRIANSSSNSRSLVLHIKEDIWILVCDLISPIYEIRKIVLSQNILVFPSISLSKSSWYGLVYQKHWPNTKNWQTFIKWGSVTWQNTSEAITRIIILYNSNNNYFYLMRFGMETLIVNTWSPRIDGLFNFGTPLLDNTSTSPGCVPGGICNSVLPSTVCTC